MRLRPAPVLAAAALVPAALVAGCTAPKQADEPIGYPTGRGPSTAQVARPPAEAQPGSAGLERTDALERRWALAGVLPHAGADYRIDYVLDADGSPAVEVTLLVELNGADDLASYRARLAAAKAAALTFLAAGGAEAGTSTLRWLPPEAAGL